MGPLGQGLLDPSGIRVVGQLKQGLVSIAPRYTISDVSNEQYQAFIIFIAAGLCKNYRLNMSDFTPNLQFSVFSRNY